VPELSFISCYLAFLLSGLVLFADPCPNQPDYDATILSLTLGCFVFLLSPPLLPENEDGIFDAVLQGHIDFASDPWPSISSSAKDLVKKMLRQDPKERLTAAEILSKSIVKLARHTLAIFVV
jgi:serine/threonine protein kinase